MPKDAFSGRLESRWDDAKAAGMSEPELLLYRSNLLGADKRITNYGGGNTSAKVTETDPLTREPVMLWVKGSGGDVGSMKLDGFSTLYMESSKPSNPSTAAPPTRTRWSATSPTPPSASTPAPPRSTPPSTPMSRAATSTTCTPTPSSPSPPPPPRRSSPPGILRRRHRLAALEAPRLRARPLAGEIRPREPGRPRRRPRKPRPLHLGRHRQGLLRNHARRHQPGHRLARPLRPPASPPSAAPNTPRSPPADAAASPPR